MKPVVFRPAAAAEVEEAFDWYEAHRPGLGEGFRSAVREKLELIAVNPELYQVVHRDTRRALLKRFPYGLFYREFPNVIVIVACMHVRRSPRRWRSRS